MPLQVCLVAPTAGAAQVKVEEEKEETWYRIESEYEDDDSIINDFLANVIEEVPQIAQENDEQIVEPVVHIPKNMMNVPQIEIVDKVVEVPVLKEVQVPKITKIQDRIDVDTIICNAAISACEEGGQWGEALALLSRMAKDRIDMDTMTCNAAINACGQWGEALTFLSRMAKDRIDVDIITYNAAISAWEILSAQGGQWGEALALMSRMAKDRIDVDKITCNAAISAYEIGGQWGEALTLLSRMAKDRIDVNTITCNAAIIACEKGGQWGEALTLLSRMAKDMLRQ